MLNYSITCIKTLKFYFLLLMFSFLFRNYYYFHLNLPTSKIIITIKHNSMYHNEYVFVSFGIWLSNSSKVVLLYCIICYMLCIARATYLLHNRILYMIIQMLYTIFHFKYYFYITHYFIVAIHATITNVRNLTLCTLPIYCTY